MLTNKITGFSADLLNTVRGILGEAKKCPTDCECEKCEAEEMKEGSMPTSDEPTDANKKTADKVRAMMAKEKKLKEDIMEMVNEAADGLSDKAKKSGISLSTLKKVYARGIAAWNSGHRPGTTPQQWAHARVNSYITKGKGTYHGADKDLRSEGTDMPFEKPYKKVGERKDEYGNKVKNVAKYLAKKAMNKQKNEEVEQVDEISSDMAYRYLKGKRERDYDISADGKSSTTKKPQTFAKMNKDAKSSMRALRTIEKAKKTNEEAEHNNCGTPECCGECNTPGQIDELSVKKLDQYRTRARQDIIDADDNDDNRMADKRAGGYLDASRKIHKKLAKEEVDQIDESLSKLSNSDLHHKYRQAVNTLRGMTGTPPEDREGSGFDGAWKMHSKTADTHGAEIKRRRALPVDHPNHIEDKSKFFKKNVKEEVEELDEVSKATLGRYINKAKDSIDTASYRQGHKEAHGSSSKPLEKKLTKRHKGISTAVSKLTKEEEDFVDSLNNEIFEKVDPYDIAGMIKKAKAKNDPNHPAMKHVAAIEDIKKHGGALSVQGDHVRSLIKALGEEVYIEEGEEKGGGYDGMPKGLQDRAPKGRARNAMGRAIARKERNLTRARMDRAAEMKKEEVEQIDEISKGTAMKALQHVSSDPDDVRGYTLQKKIGKKWPEMKGHAADASYTAGYGRSGRNIFQDRDKLADRAKTSYRMTKDGKANKQDLKARFRKEEIELDEARGRPRKAGAKDFTIHPKTKEKLMHNNPADMKRIERLQKNGVLEKPKVEAGQHIMNQLQKAKTSMLGGSKINFTHGDSKEVSGPHAAKILTKYAGMKPNEKEDFQKFVGHSHENLMKHV